MPKLGPTRRKVLIRCLRQAGFDGPYSGGKHRFMRKGALKLRVPNTDLDTVLLKRILKQAGISEADWENLG